MIRHEYECSRGHWVAGPEPFVSCPVLVRGRPCTGALHQVAPPPGAPRRTGVVRARRRR